MKHFKLFVKRFRTRIYFHSFASHSPHDCYLLYNYGYMTVGLVFFYLTYLNAQIRHYNTNEILKGTKYYVLLMLAVGDGLSLVKVLTVCPFLTAGEIVNYL